MKRFLIIVVLIQISTRLCICSEERDDIVTVRMKILEAPKPYVFPAPACEGVTVSAQTGQVSVVQLILPTELSGKRFEFFHLPPLNSKTSWEDTGGVYECELARKYIGGAYPARDKSHTSLIPYSKYIQGDLRKYDEQRNDNIQPVTPANGAPRRR